VHRLLPPNKTLQYKLRPRNHNLMLTCKSSYCDSCNFIARILFREAYWRSCLFTYVLSFCFNLLTMFSALCHTCMCVNAVCHWFIKLLSDLIWPDSNCCVEVWYNRKTEKLRGHSHLPICSAVLMKRCEKIDSWIVSSSGPIRWLGPLPTYQHQHQHQQHHHQHH